MVKVPVSQSVVLFAPQILANYPVNVGPVRLYLAGAKSSPAQTGKLPPAGPQRITERL